MRIVYYGADWDCNKSLSGMMRWNNGSSELASLTPFKQQVRNLASISRAFPISATPTGDNAELQLPFKLNHKSDSSGQSCMARGVTYFQIHQTW